MKLTDKLLRKMINEELRSRRSRGRLDEMMGMGRLADENEFQSDFESSWDTSDELPPSDMSADVGGPEFIDLTDDELSVLSIIDSEGYGSALSAFGDEAHAIVQTLVGAGLLRNDQQSGSYFVTPAGRQYIADDLGRY